MTKSQTEWLVGEATLTKSLSIGASTISYSTAVWNKISGQEVDKRSNADVGLERNDRSAGKS